MRGLVLLAVATGCSQASPPQSAQPRALLTSLTASVELQPNGLPGPEASAWVAEGPSGLSAVPTQISLDAKVNGAPLPPGKLDRLHDGLRYSGTGKGYRFDLECREAGTFVFELKVVSNREPQVDWEVALPPGWRTQREITRHASGPQHTLSTRIRITSPMDPPAWQVRIPRIKLVGPKEDQARLDDLARQLGGDRSVEMCGLAPFGSSNAKYTGRVFWDADVWLLPALALTHPARARAIPAFRIRTFPAASAAFQRKYAGQGDGIIVAWETGPDGRELCTGPGIHAAHVTGSAAWGMDYASRLGLVEADAAKRFLRAACFYYLNRATVNSSTVNVEQTLSPDEYAMTPSDTYTNLVAQRFFLLDRPHIPMSGDRVLNFEGDQDQKLQQHALLLGLWPLEHPALLARASQILAHEKGRTIANGPAMSLSMEALLEARYAKPGEALDTWRRAIDRYSHGPARSFGETPRQANGTFLTGVAGCWSAVLYGFAGIHVGPSPVEGAVWKRRLKSGSWLSAQPHFPPEWKSLSVTLYVDGEPVELVLTHDGPAKKGSDSR